MYTTKKYGLLITWLIIFALFSATCLICGCYHRQKENVLAYVNKDEILANDFIEFYNTRPRIAAWTSQDGRLDPNHVLNALIEKALLAQKAKKMKFDQMHGFKEQMKNFEEKELVQTFINKWFAPKIHISDEEVLQTIPDYQKKEVRFARISVLTEAEALEIKKELDQGGDFSHLARTRSIGIEAENGGVGDFLSPHRGIYHKDVIKVIFTLPIGKVSTPQKIREGYALFKPIEERPLDPDEMEQVMQYRRGLMFREKKNSLIRDLLDKTKKERNITINQKAIEAIASGDRASLESTDPVLAQGKGLKVHAQDLRATLTELVQPPRGAWEDPNLVLRVLKSRISQAIMVSEAKKAGFHKDPEFKKQTQRYKQDLLVRHLTMNEIEKQLDITQEESLKYYQENLALFSEPEMVQVSHILLKDKQKAQEILLKLQQGEEFASLAREHSEYKISAKKDGDMGYIHPGESGMGQEFEQAAFSLQKGEISGILNTQFGYQILLVKDKKPARTYPFEQVKNRISQELRNRKRQDLFENYLKELHTEADIKINQTLFQEILQTLSK